MAKLTIDLPDNLIEQLELTGVPLKEILSQALVEYLATHSAVKDITQTRTWELCGSLTIATD